MGLLNFIMYYFGSSFIMYAWVTSLVFISVLIVIYPTFIAPLFNKFEPLDKNNEKEKQILLKTQELC